MGARSAPQRGSPGFSCFDGESKRWYSHGGTEHTEKTKTEVRSQNETENVLLLTLGFYLLTFAFLGFLRALCGSVAIPPLPHGRGSDDFMTTPDLNKKPGALTGCRVLDLTTPLGHLCGKILGDLGADVIKVEPPAGDAGRFRRPFYYDGCGGAHSLFWLAYNNNKRSVTLNLETGDGREILRRMARKADFFLESYPPGYLDSLGLGHEALLKENPRLVVTAMTPFGQTGPYRDFQAEDLEIMASCGVMSLTGHPGKAPLRISLSQSEAWASLYCAMGALTA